jgi:predicted phosphodiesterase
LARYAGDVVVFGHTHRAVTLRAPDGRLAVNPGAAGPRRFDVIPSVARLILSDGSVGSTSDNERSRRFQIQAEIIPLG